MNWSILTTAHETKGIGTFICLKINREMFNREIQTEKRTWNREQERRKNLTDPR